MKKIIYSVLLVLSIFAFFGCDFGKNPFDDTEWHCYRCVVSMEGGIVTEQSCNETWYFYKGGSFAKDSSRGYVSGSWDYDDTTLNISYEDYRYGYVTESYSVELNDDDLILTIDYGDFSYTYYLSLVEQEKDDSSILDWLPF